MKKWQLRCVEDGITSAPPRRGAVLCSPPVVALVPAPARPVCRRLGTTGLGGLVCRELTCPSACSAEQRGHASASPGGAGGLDQVRGAHLGVSGLHRGRPPGLGPHLLPATRLSPQAEGEAVGTGGPPGHRCHRRLPGKERLFPVMGFIS